MIPSAAQVFTGRSGGRGDNSGSAAVLDEAANMLPYIERMQERIRTDKIAEDARIRAAQKEQDKAWQGLEMDMPDVWAADSAHLEGNLKDYHDSIVEAKMKGENPNDLYSPFGKERKKRETDLRKSTAIAKDNETYFNANKEAIAKDAGGKYDKKYAADWFKKYTDPKLTPKERADMRLNSSPYKLNYSATAFVNDTIPDPIRNGYTIGVDKGAHMARIAGVLASPEGKEMFESLKEGDENTEQFTERIADLGQEMYKPSKMPTPKPSAPRTTVVERNYGTGVWGKDLSIQADTLDEPDFATGINRIAVTKNNGELPKVKATKDDGTLITFEPAEFYLKPNGQISARGLDQDGEEVWINYGKNKSKFVSQLDGFDVEEEFKIQNGAQKTGGTRYVGLDDNGDPIFE